MKIYDKKEKNNNYKEEVKKMANGINERELSYAKELSTLSARLDEHIHQCPKQEILNLNETVNENKSSLTFLKNFIVPLISIGNVVFLGILIYSISSLQVKLDQFISEYYKDREQNIKFSIEDAKKNTKFFSRIESNSEKIGDLKKRVERLESVYEKIVNKR